MPLAPKNTGDLTDLTHYQWAKKYLVKIIADARLEASAEIVGGLIQEVHRGHAIEDAARMIQTAEDLEEEEEAIRILLDILDKNPRPWRMQP